MGNIYRVSDILQLNFQQIISKYEKRQKYLPVLHKTTYNNYFIVKCLLKSNVARVILPSY